MAKLFRNKYRTTSHRKPEWDYSGNGMYFITFVTQKRECNLGKIVNNEMTLFDFGRIVEKEWLQSFEIRAELILDEWIIMPNHLHAIVILDKNRLHASMDVATHGRASLHASPQRLPKSISSFMAGFKSAVNSKIDDYIDANNLDIPKYNRNNHFWQPNYYDSIIQNNESYIRVRQYIKNNPKNWGKDELNGRNV
ncbi:MAG: transposase [Bacteroidales bacterium]